MTKNRLALTAAVLISGCASSTSVVNSRNMTTEDSNMGQCNGINACKGSASCAVSGQNHCAGQNTCRGKGWVALSKSDCNAQNGSFSDFENN